MGMWQALVGRWQAVNQSHLDDESRASGVAGAILSAWALSPVELVTRIHRSAAIDPD